MKERIAGCDVSLAILTVPSTFAQETADIIVKSGIKAIWNFTNAKLKLPEDVVCQQEDLTSGYAMLCVMMDSKREKIVQE